MIAFAAALAALLAAALATLFWQMKRAAKSSDGQLACVQENAELKILNAAANVALTDKEKAMNMLIAERDRLQFSLETVEDQRDDLLDEALQSDNPGAIAHALRDALARLQPVSEMPETEDLLDVPGAANHNGD